jgi:hypothetical protein
LKSLAPIIPWRDVEINQNKFEKVVDRKYVQRPFKEADIVNNTLKVAREKKENKYGEIVKEAKMWLERNKDDIAIKYKVTKNEVDCNYIIISNLGMVPKATEVDLCRLLRNDDKEKVRYAPMWLKRMINQIIRGSFECYINAGKEITEIDHVIEVNQNIEDAEGSINMNLWALNEEMGNDSHIKEKLDIQKLKKIIPEEKLKNFIELPNDNQDVVVRKETINLLNNEPPQEEQNIFIVDDDDEPISITGEPVKVKVDVSSTSETDSEDREPESEEDEVILVGDGEEKNMRKYTTEICIPQSNESGMITGGKIRKVIIPADSESLDNESG